MLSQLQWAPVPPDMQSGLGHAHEMLGGRILALTIGWPHPPPPLLEHVVPGRLEGETLIALSVAIIVSMGTGKSMRPAKAS